MSNRYSTVDPTKMPPAPRRAEDDYFVKVSRPAPQRQEWTPTVAARPHLDLREATTTTLSVAKQVLTFPFKLWWFLFRIQFTAKYWAAVFAVAIIAGVIQNA